MFEWFDREFKRVIMAIVLFGLLALIVESFCGCKLPTAVHLIKTHTVDTGFFEIETSEVGRSNKTEWGRMNQWRVIIEEATWGIDDSVWVEKIIFTLWFKEDHPEQNIGFWFAAPVHNMTLKKNQKRIQYTFPVGWNASVLSCGVFTNLHGAVRLKAKIFYQ